MRVEALKCLLGEIHALIECYCIFHYPNKSVKRKLNFYSYYKIIFGAQTPSLSQNDWKPVTTLLVVALPQKVTR